MKFLSPSILVLAGAIGLTACSGSSPASSHNTSSSTTTSQAVTAQSPTSSAPTSSSVTSSSTPTTNPPETAAPGAPIKVTGPAAGATVTSPLSVTGTSRLGGQAVQLVLTDGSGNVLCSATAHPNPSGDFGATMRFAGPAGPGSLAAFVSGAGGAREDLIQVPLHLSD